MANAEDKSEISHDVLLKRLRRIEGQIRGIEKMIETDRDCVSIVIQLAAVRSGIEGIGALILNNCMRLCFREGTGDVLSWSRADRAIELVLNLESQKDMSELAGIINNPG